ncbi:DNA processing protein [Lachnospiraceae bacterium]|nr:DNA processing protein [Lachnospiraceae bacterium]
MEQNNCHTIKCVTPLDMDFPDRLRDIPDCPNVLYIRGKLPDPKRPTVGIIGSRNASQYGLNMARHFASCLSDAGVQIISGMARGIDGVSQRTAMEAGHPTFGILGCGVDVLYPKENRDLFMRIPERGGLISEFPPGTQPVAKFFPSRNRIISGLSDILLVVEARIKSGTGITVRRALEQGRDVYAVPGRITDPLSAGCNRLIADGAGTALSPDVILEALGIYPENVPGTSLISGGVRENDKRVRLAKDEKMVYSFLDLYPKTLDELVCITDLSVQKLLPVLLQLMMKGLVAEAGKNNYYRKSQG